MKLTIAVIFAFLSTTAVYAEIYNYSCKACLFPGIVSGDGFGGCDVVDGKTYPLRVDDKKNVLEWRGKKYSLTSQATKPKTVGNMVGTQKVMERPLHSAVRRRDTQPLRTRTVTKSNATLKGDGLAVANSGNLRANPKFV